MRVIYSCQGYLIHEHVDPIEIRAVYNAASCVKVSERVAGKKLWETDDDSTFQSVFFYFHGSSVSPPPRMVHELE